MANTEIIKRQTVEEIVGHRNRAIEQYDLMMQCAEAMKIAHRRACSPTGNGMEATGPCREFMPRHDRERFVRELDGQCWRNLATMTRIGELMDVKEREIFHEQLRTAPIAVTVDNVIATLGNLMGKAGDIFNRSVVATFEALPASYRSNDGFKFGKRIVFRCALINSTIRDRSGRTVHYLSLNYRNDAEGRIRDLDRIWHMVDGNTLPDDRDPQGAVQAIRTQLYQKRSEGFEIESRHFYLKGHLNGALHIWPKDRDLTAKVNQILARHYGWVLGDGQKGRKSAARRKHQTGRASSQTPEKTAGTAESAMECS